MRGVTGVICLSTMLVAGLCTGCGDPRRNDPFLGGASDVPAPPPPPPPPPPDVAPTGQCRTQSDCDDRIACTDDECVFGGRCEHTPVMSRCPSGQRCIAGVGCASGTMCTTSAQCDDSVPCTRDLCGADRVCQNINDDSRCTGGMVCTSAGCAAPGSCMMDRDCDNRRFCDGDERCVSGRCVAGTMRDCGDGDPCTGDICNEAMARCDHPPVSPCGGAVMPGTYALSPPVMYRCPSYTLGPVSTITLSTTAGGIQVAGFPIALNGPTPTGGMFAVTGIDTAGQTFNLSFQGNFMNSSSFLGAFSVACPLCSAFSMCPAGSSVFTATRR